MTLVISEAPHALDLTGGRVLGRGETANVNLSNSHEAAYYDEGWLTIIDGSSPPPPPTPPESIQVAGSPFQTGQVIYYNGLEWVVLNPGDAGEVLMTHGVNAIPEWVPIDVSMFAFDPATQSELDVHAADTTAVHGIANTADILYKTLADAKGDIFVATAPDTLSRLPVGSDNTFLKANSAQPAGVEWASVPSPDLTPYAPKASPSFTGTIGLPTYTLATRPLASVGAGKAIYVSDAAQGQKFQTSDGSVWSTVAVVLDALSASTPDRIAWEFPAGTDIVEVWADRTAAGQVLTHIDQMNSAGPYVGNSPGGAFDSAYVSGGVMTIPSNVNRYLYRTDWGLFADTDRTEVLFKAVGALPLNLTGLFNWHQASNTYMGIGIVNTGAVINGIGGSAPQLLAPGTIVVGVTYRLRLTRQGNNCDWAIIRESDQVVIGSGTIAAPANCGAGAGLYPLIAASPGSGATVVWDDLTHYTVQPEQRDLWLAVTPASGTRTVRRLLGSYGSATMRSDFAQMVAAGTAQAIQIPTFTLATRPTATGIAGALIYVSDAGRGFELQYSNGTSWFSTNPFNSIPANTQTGTTYTLALTDIGLAVEMNNAGAMTLTVPPNSSVAFPIGTVIDIVRIGAGTLTIAQGAGVTLPNKIEAAGTTNRTVTAQYGVARLRKRATDQWVLSGDIA
jgi:hypothetical protein